MELHQIVSDETFATRAIGLEIKSRLHLRSFILHRLRARSGLLSLVGIANHLEEIVALAHDLAVHNHPRNPFVVSRGLVSSNKVKSRSLSTLSTGQNHFSIHSSSSSALLHTFVREIDRGFLAKNERPPVRRIMLLRAQLNIVTIALLISVLALEGRRITRDHMSISIRNEFQIGNSHQILSLMELHQIVSNEVLAGGAERLVIKRSFHFVSLKAERYTK